MNPFPYPRWTREHSHIKKHRYETDQNGHTPLTKSEVRFRPEKTYVIHPIFTPSFLPLFGLRDAPSPTWRVVHGSLFRLPVPPSRPSPVQRGKEHWSFKLAGNHGMDSASTGDFENVEFSFPRGRGKVGMGVHWQGADLSLVVLNENRPQLLPTIAVRGRPGSGRCSGL